MRSFSSLLALVSALPYAIAHGGQGMYEIDGVQYNGWVIESSLGHGYNDTTQNTIQRPWFDVNPIGPGPTDTGDLPPWQLTDWLSCGEVTTNKIELGFNPNQKTANIKAGSSISSQWYGDTSYGSDFRPWYHNVGPVLSYLARCPGTSCDGVAAKSLKWFKIDESGLQAGTVAYGYWGNTQLMSQNSTWTTVIPKSVPSGPYLYRHETINLARAPVDVQLFVQCAQLNIIDGGSLEPTEKELVTFPGAYGLNDPAWNVSIYTAAAQTQTTYVLPGPPLYAGATPRQPSIGSAKFRGD